MRRAFVTAVCAMAAAAVLWGCGGAAGGDVQKNNGVEETDGQGNGAQSGEDAAVGGASQTTGGSGANDGAPGQSDGNAENGGSAAVGSGSGENAETAAAEGGVDMAAQLAGTTFSILGDSISTYQGCNPVGYYAFFPENGEVTEVEDTWWQRVADDLELTVYANGSSSGATVAGDSTETENPQ